MLLVRQFRLLEIDTMGLEPSSILFKLDDLVGLEAVSPNLSATLLERPRYANYSAFRTLPSRQVRRTKRYSYRSPNRLENYPAQVHRSLVPECSEPK